MQQKTCPTLPTHMMKISLKLTFQVAALHPAPHSIPTQSAI
ncbi:Uncharacterised protein [Eikenella corrodens]|uniref:Uncharacterized protein n=2 Tax=Eikenella corrodens TaxID=539 RepID=C0DV54_EIKCO|nr:hypothetical protein [Eikenella corrodens]EEG24074.1 hypothetical protein EIKCOROL_01243 [Eikenella corrodens ATCC 23834]SNW06705.1 Uncharacterised protein [Eikenella corrodens]